LLEKCEGCCVDYTATMMEHARTHARTHTNSGI